IINEIFNELLLNKSRKITHLNFAAMKAFVGFRMAEIDKLTLRQRERRANKVEGWEKTGFSRVTIRNLRICVAGLFLTAEEAISRNAGIPTFYFSVLKGTTSADEGIFSFARAKGANTELLFGAMVAGLNARSSAHGLLSKNNKAYTEEEIEPERESFAALSHQNVKERNKHNDAVVAEWTQTASSIPNAPLVIEVFERIISDFESRFTLATSSPIGEDILASTGSISSQEQLSLFSVASFEKRLANKGEFLATYFPRHFLAMRDERLLRRLIDSDRIHAYMTVCVNSVHARWFQALVSIRDIQTASLVETILWAIVHACYASVDRFHSQSIPTREDRKPLNSYLRDYLRTREVSILFRSLGIAELELPPALEAAVFSCVVDLFHKQILAFRQVALPDTPEVAPSYDPGVLNAKSHSLLGWSISKCFIREVGKTRRFPLGSPSHTIAKHKLDGLGKMRLFEKDLDIIQQDDEDFCSHHFRAGNLGYKTMIVPHLLPFALSLLEALRGGVDVKRCGNDAVTIAKERFNSNSIPRRQWEKAWASIFANSPDFLDDTALRDAFYHELTNACFNAHTAAVLRHVRNTMLSRYMNKKENLMALRDVLKVKSGGKGLKRKHASEPFASVPPTAFYAASTADPSLPGVNTSNNDTLPAPAKRARRNPGDAPA
ncbi:hypothetical protein HDU98_001997, partial [Podochytrium sp. JEL0797]